MEEKRWLTVMGDPEFRSFTVMAVSPAETRCIVLGNIHGKLRIFVADDGKLHGFMTNGGFMNGCKLVTSLFV